MYLCRGFRQEAIAACFCLNTLVEFFLLLDNIPIDFLLTEAHTRLRLAATRACRFHPLFPNSAG